MDQQPSSPTFSIVDSDEEDSEEATPKPASPVAAAAESSTASPSPQDDAIAAPHALELSPSLADPASSTATAADEEPPVVSPVEASSRSMVLEEAEVFRKGLALGVDIVVPSDSEDDDTVDNGGRRSLSVSPSRGGGGGGGVGKGTEEVSGEELKKEILEAEIDEDLLAVSKGGKRRGSRGSFSAEEAERPDFNKAE